jgi:hypothetical protein
MITPEGKASVWLEVMFDIARQDGTTEEVWNLGRGLTPGAIMSAQRAGRLTILEMDDERVKVRIHDERN